MRKVIRLHFCAAPGDVVMAGCGCPAKLTREEAERSVACGAALWRDARKRELLALRKTIAPSDAHAGIQNFWSYAAKYLPLKRADGSSVNGNNKPQRPQLSDGRKKRLARIAIERSGRVFVPLCVGGCGEAPPPGFVICVPCFEAEQVRKLKKSRLFRGARRNLPG